MLIPRVGIKVLELTADVLEGMGITYWLDSGTLLSAVRDGRLNNLDHDIDIRCFNKDFDMERRAELIKRLYLAGYKWFEGDKTFDCQLLCYHDLRIILDLKFCHTNGEYVWNYCFQEPRGMPMIHAYHVKFFETLDRIELNGRLYPCPREVGKYIICHYGPEWREFKLKPKDAGKTDMTWDYMYDPPSSVTLGQFEKMLGHRLTYFNRVGQDI